MEVLLWRSLVLLAVFAVGESRSAVQRSKITKIQKTTTSHISKDPVDETIICTDSIPEDANTYLLVYTIDQETDVQAEGPIIDVNCLKFPVPMSTFVEKKTEFILAFHNVDTGDDSNDILVGEAEADLTIPEISGDFKAAWVGERAQNGGTVRDLRVSGVTLEPCEFYIGVSSEPINCKCNAASCFALGVGNIENGDSDIFNCQKVENMLVGESKEFVDVCTMSTVATVINQKGPIIDKVKLSYVTETVSITAEASGNTAADVVVSWEDEFYVFGPFSTLEEDCSISSYTSGEKMINVLVVGTTETDVQESVIVELQDYNLVGTAVSGSTLEMRWTKDTDYIHYWATLLSETQSIDETEVTCDESLKHCYAYFTNVVGGGHTVSIQPYDETGPEKISTNEIVSKKVEMTQQCSSKALHISQIKLSWNSEGSTAEVRVCLDHPGSVSVPAAAQLLLVDAMGRWHRTHGLTQKMDGFPCFAEVTLDSHLFNLTKKVAVVVTEWDVDGLSVIASGQSDVFFISPRVESISKDRAYAFWSNPGEYTFLIRRTDHPAPLVTSLTCSNCFHYLSKISQMTEEERLVVETEDLGVRITAEIPLLLPAASGDISTVTINKIVRRLSSNIDICFQEDLSQVTVTHAEITVIIPSEGSITNEENVGGHIADGSCASFAKLPDMPTDQRVVFELRLYEGTEESYTQIRRGSIDFTMPDLTTFPVCNLAHKVGDKKMLRLACSTFGEDMDATLMLIDGETFTSKDIDGMSQPEIVRYILMKKVVEGTKLSFQCTVTDVIVNDELEGQSVEVFSDTLSIQDATANEPEFTSLMLQYNPKQTMVEISPDSIMVLADVVNYWEEEDYSYSIFSCPRLKPDSLSCVLSNYNPGFRKLNVLVIGYKSEGMNDMLTSTKHELQDYGLSGSFITGSTIEVQWTMSTDMTYRATLQTVSTENKVQELRFTLTDVTCDKSDSFCYVYFLDLTDNSQYNVMLQPKTGDTPDDMNKVVSEEIKHLVAMDDSTKRILAPTVKPLTWSNPGDHTFTIKRHIPLVPFFTCDTCSYSWSSQESGTQGERDLVFETQDTPIKLTAGITLDMLFAGLPKLHIDYLTFPISKDPSGSIVSVVVRARSEQLVSEVNELTLSFILPHDSDAAAQYTDSINVSELSEEGDEYTFPNIPDFALVAGEVVVMIVAHMDNEAVAVNYARVTLEDIDATAAKVGKVGEGYEAFRFVFSKSSSNGDVQLDYTSSCNCVSSPCYCLGDRVDGEPWPLCLNLKFSEPEIGTLLYCDDKLQANVADTDVPVTKVTMTRKDADTVNILVEVNSDETLNKVEILVYEVSDKSVTSPSTTCSDKLNECQVTSLEMSKDVTTFSILVVGVDSSEAVLQSTLLSFEDYQVVVQQLTADAVEVRWAASEKTLYKVTASPNGGAFSTTTVTCGSDESNKCKAYFISITDSDPRTVRVQKNEDGDKNIVASMFTLESLAKESPRNATLLLRKRNDKTYFIVCLDKQARTTANYTLAIIDQKGAFVDTTGTNPCFPELVLNTLMMEHLRVLVHTKPDDMEGFVALDTDVYLLDSNSAYNPLQIIQIGARTLKASWTNRNKNNLQYEMALNGKTNFVECKAKAECIKYIHLEYAHEPPLIHVTESNKGTVQVATVDVPIMDIQEMSILSSAIQSDNRLRVCFLKPQGAVSYELGLESDSHHLETITRAQVMRESNGNTCVISSGNVDFGAITELWMLVTAYSNNGSILASGENTWRTICK